MKMKINCNLVSLLLSASLILFNLLFFSCRHSDTSGYITEENYILRDSILWAEYSDVSDRIFDEISLNPEKKDSLRVILDSLYNKVSEENVMLAKKFFSVPSGLQRLYMTRCHSPKDTLRMIYSKLSGEMKSSLYGTAIKEYIETEQIVVGDSLYTFDVLTISGDSFDWNSLSGRNILLLYGGLGCMGERGRDVLFDLYNRFKDKLSIIVYWPSSSLDELKEIADIYSVPYTFVSDFMQELSPIRIKYASQATPTCFFADKNHIIRAISTGFKPDSILEYLE